MLNIGVREGLVVVVVVVIGGEGGGLEEIGGSLGLLLYEGVESRLALDLAFEEEDEEVEGLAEGLFVAILPELGGLVVSMINARILLRHHTS